MARVTVEDCITKIQNRFDLVMLAAQRARAVSAGAALTIERDDDKNPVIALREIAEESIDLGELEDHLIKSLQKHVEIDEPEEEEMDLLAFQEDVAAGLTEEAVDAQIAADLIVAEENAGETEKEASAEADADDETPPKEEAEAGDDVADAKAKED